MLGNGYGRAYSEESPGCMNRQYLLTAGEGNLRESATESKPPL